MVSIKLDYLRRGRGPGRLVYRVSMYGESCVVDSGLDVEADGWDKRRGLMPNHPLAHLARAGKARLVFIVERLEKMGLEICAADIARYFAEYSRENTVGRLFDAACTRLNDAGRRRTAETYRAARNSFMRFTGGEDPAIDLIDQEMMLDYENFMRERGLQPNTTSFYMRIMRALYNRAVSDGLLAQQNPFKRVYTGVAKTDKRALTAMQIRRIREFGLADKPSLAYARDMFMMSFYLRGMSIIDMAYLRKSDLRHGRIYYRRRKTGRPLAIRWQPEMQAIVDRYALAGSSFLIPMIKDGNADPLFAYRRVAWRINKSLKIIGKMLGLTIPLTMYVARHSWASVAHRSGIPVSVISEGMGHDSETTTRIYLASLDASVIDRANAAVMRKICR